MVVHGVSLMHTCHHSKVDLLKHDFINRYSWYYESTNIIETDLYEVKDGPQVKGIELVGEEDSTEASREDQMEEQGAEGFKEEDQSEECPTEASE